MQKLFRQEAVEEQRSRLHGEVLLLPKASYTVILLCLVAWVAAVFGWAFTNTYARKERVMGWVEPATGVANIYSSGEGVVEEIFVQDGDAVVDGQPLIVISGDRMLAGGSRMGALLAEELAAQSEILQERLAQTAEMYGLRLTDIEEQIKAGSQDLSSLEGQLETMRQRIEISRSQLKDIIRLRQSGHASGTELDSIQQQTLILVSERQALVREKNLQLSRIQQLKNQRDRLPIEKANAIDDVKSRLSDNSQEMARLHGQNSHVVYALKSGVVTNLQVRVGQKAIANVPLLSIAPEESKLRLQLLVPVRAIGFVETGQKLEVRYDAFPYEKFGLYPGEITGVSRTILLPGELMGGPLAPKEPVYRVSARLERDYVNAYGSRLPLRAGMTLSADIRLGDRTLIEWLLEPIYSLKGAL